MMQRGRHTIDARGLVAGRLASTVAALLQGKHKPTFERHTDPGDYVHIQNVADMVFSGTKLEKKVYHRATGYPGHLKTIRLRDAFARKPEKLLRDMIYRMLPKNKLSDRMIKRLSFDK